MQIRGITDTYTNVGRLIRDPNATNDQSGQFPLTEGDIPPNDSSEASPLTENIPVRRKREVSEVLLTVSQAWEVTDSMVRRIISVDSGKLGGLLPDDPAEVNFVKPRYV